MAELTDRMIDAALERGRIAQETEPRAIDVRYEEAAARIVVDLANGTSFTFPPHLVQGLAGACAEDIAQVEVFGGGYGLHWKRLDVDYTVPGLVNGIFGTARWMAAHAGRATSPAKAEAARSNGAKGGRPRKSDLASPAQSGRVPAMASAKGLPTFRLQKDEAKGDWVLRKADARRAIKRFETKSEAIARGVLKSAIGKSGGTVVIHLENGRFEEERTFPRERNLKRLSG